MPRTGLRRLGTVSVLLAATLSPVTSSAVADGRGGNDLRGGKGMSATIRYTEYGIPHIVAHDYTGLGFGTGYAAAKDNLCVLAQGMVTLHGERSRYFGPQAAPDGSLSSAGTNLASDMFFTAINDSRVVERLAERPAPYGPSREVRELGRGWAAGYNKYLREEKISDPACKGAPWVRPITELDVSRRGYALAMLGGSGRMADQLATSKPPAAADQKQPQQAQKIDTAKVAAEARALTAGADMGSNAIAVGRGATADGRGLLLGNPHYPWQGGRRFWQMHQTIPGKLNVSGGALLGSTSVSIGHTGTMAWSHTVATGVPFTVSQLQLVPGDPTSYVVDGRTEKMTQRRITVQAKQPDGSVKPVEGTQWRTRYGPVVTSLGSVPLPWTGQNAYALNDPNAANLRIANTSLELGKARTTDDVIRALKRTQGMPWVNTLAADSRGKAVYAQIQVLPNVTNDFAATCNTPMGKAVFAASGVAILDGAKSSCTPGRASGTLQSGILSPDRYPVLERRDYVTNSNDSHWLTNPDRPLEGFDRIIGNERTARSLRTRSGLVAVEDQLKKGEFTRKAMQDLVFANRNHAGELAGDDTVAMCRQMQLGKACEVLDRWDRTNNVDSRGALLFDRYWRKAAGAQDLWRVPFDASDAVNTPRGLNTGSATVRKALTDAIAELASSGIPLDGKLGDHQYVTRNGERIPIGGGTESQGILNKIEATWTPGKGYTEVAHGSSYVQVVAFGRGHCPDTRTLLTYSQSSDPTSPHHADQTRLFARNGWVTERFCEQDIRRSPELKIVRLRGR
ncbi:penicillin acylase family protein [Actinomadura sp. 9N407]|uniref:penicillin acylase family protein n=1 Tax=Actinomadura sp. 9N407 TaxID=3375154 RepID=UPI0037A5E026